MSSLTIYGASDDLVEVEGAVREEYPLGDGSETRLRVTSPDGMFLDVVLTFGVVRDVGILDFDALDWQIVVECLVTYPDWPIHFHQRPNYEGDPAVTLDVPAGTRVEVIA